MHLTQMSSEAPQASTSSLSPEPLPPACFPCSIPGALDRTLASYL